LSWIIGLLYIALNSTVLTLEEWEEKFWIRGRFSWTIGIGKAVLKRRCAKRCRNFAKYGWTLQHTWHSEIYTWWRKVGTLSGIKTFLLSRPLPSPPTCFHSQSAFSKDEFWLKYQVQWKLKPDGLNWLSGNLRNHSLYTLKMRKN